MENFFSRDVCWRHERAQLEYEARSRNWIWLDKFTSYVINVVRDTGIYMNAVNQQSLHDS